MNEPVIALHHLSKSFGNVHAVQDLSLTIEVARSLVSRSKWRRQDNHDTNVVRLRHPTGACHDPRGGYLARSPKVRTKSDTFRNGSAFYASYCGGKFRFFGGAYGVPGAEQIANQHPAYA